MPIFRIHITCKAGHTTYQDYTRMTNARKAFARMQANPGGWYPVNIEKITA